MSVAELLLPAGSDTPLGVEIVTVFVRVPELVDTVPDTMNVTEPPTGRSIGALMLPLPFDGQLALPVDEQVQLTPLSPLGMMSETNAAETDDGPALLATIVYVTAEPDDFVEAPSVIVTDRSALGGVVVVGGMVVVVGARVVVGTGAALPTFSLMVVPGNTESVDGMLCEMTCPSSGESIATVTN